MPCHAKTKSHPNADHERNQPPPRTAKAPEIPRTTKLATLNAGTVPAALLCVLELELVAVPVAVTVMVRAPVVSPIAPVAVAVTAAEDATPLTSGMEEESDWKSTMLLLEELKFVCPIAIILALRS